MVQSSEWRETDPFIVAPTDRGARAAFWVVRREAMQRVSRRYAGVACHRNKTCCVLCATLTKAK
jgi:hypothetical protein